MNATTLRVRIVVLVIAALMAAVTGASVTAATVTDDAPPAGEIMMVDEIRVVNHGPSITLNNLGPSLGARAP